MKISEDSMGFKHHEKGMKNWHRLDVTVNDEKITFHCKRCGEVVVQDRSDAK